MSLSFEWVYPYLIILARFGPAVGFLPAFRGRFLPGTIRTMVSLLFVAFLKPLLEHKIGAPPATSSAFLMILCQEILTGVFIGLLIQILFLITDVAGQVLSFQMGFSTAQALNPSSSTQSAMISGFLGMFGLAIFFVTDLYALMFKALAASYSLFPLYQSHDFGDFFQLLLHFISSSFYQAVLLAMPILCIITLFFVGIGLVSKFIPGVQIFFISLPVQVMLGLIVLYYSFAGLMHLFVTFVESNLQKLITPEL